MTFIYFGTPDFSARVLETLVARGFRPLAVVTNPDRPLGRKKIVTPPPVKIVAEKHGIEVLQPEKLDEAFLARLASFNADCFVVFAYNKIFRKNVLEMPRLGVLGVHPSFLPQYRGPSPFQTALLEGEAETGVTLYRLDEGVDSGPILAKSDPVSITEEDTFGSLAVKLADVGAELLVKTLPAFFDGKITPEPQDESQATFTKKFKTEDAFVVPADLAAAEAGDAAKARALHQKIRAFTPEPGAWTMQGERRVKLLEASVRDGKLRLTRIQEEGQKPKNV